MSLKKGLQFYVENSGYPAKSEHVPSERDSRNGGEPPNQANVA